MYTSARARLRILYTYRGSRSNAAIDRALTPSPPPATTVCPPLPPPPCPPVGHYSGARAPHRTGFPPRSIVPSRHRTNMSSRSTHTPARTPRYSHTCTHTHVHTHNETRPRVCTVYIQTRRKSSDTRTPRHGAAAMFCRPVIIILKYIIDEYKKKKKNNVGYNTSVKILCYLTHCFDLIVYASYK